MIGTGWIYPNGFDRPEPAPEGDELIVEYDCFLGLEIRWRYDAIQEREAEHAG